jgi:hypothetical protein
MMNDLKWKDRDSPQIIGLAHDMCKIGAYLPDGKGGYTYNEAHPKGHGSLSLELVSKVIDLTDEEAACIRWHMGAFVGKEKWRELQEATVNEPKILYVNLADNESTTYEIRKERGIF